MDKIGVYCSSIHPALWLGLYNNLRSQNATEVEIMFVGDVSPDFDLPPGMKYIYSKVKPAQCYYIGATRVDGNYLFFLTDDVVLSPGTFDNCLEMLKHNDVNKTFITPRYSKYPMDFYGDNTYMGIVPNLSICHLASRDLWMSLGIDRNFVIAYWDCDQAMRVLSMGGKVVICESGHLIDSQKTQAVESHMCNWNNGYDRKLFYSQWTKCPHNYADSYPSVQTKQSCPPVLTRQRAFEPIVDSPDILTVSQGMKGHWV